MAQEIVYASQEVQNAISILKEAHTTMSSSIANSINSDFSVLTDLDLFSSGLSKIKDQVTSLAQIYETLIAKLQTHDTTMEQTEESMNQEVGGYIDSSSGGGGGYGGGGGSGSHGSGHATETEKPTTEDETDGKQISDQQLKEILKEFDFTNLKVALQNILNANGNLTAMLSDNYNANVLIYMLKKMLGGEVDLSKMTTTDETLIQKQLLEQIASQDENVFASLDESTYLAALPYLKKVANENNVKFSELILESKNEPILLKALEDVYNGNANSLKESEVNSVRSYIDKVASQASVSADTLLSSTSYMSVIKGGVSS